MTFDSNAWENIFHPRNRANEAIAEALRVGSLRGFICATSFQIERIRKLLRSKYFSTPHMDVQFPNDLHFIDGNPYVRITSIGPKDAVHPGLPNEQAEKFGKPRNMGFRLLRGMNWPGLPSPMLISDASLYEPETPERQNMREQPQIEGFAKVCGRGVGKAAFDAVGGRGLAATIPTSEKKFIRACAEWVDGEVAGAHIAYENDVLCTDNNARHSGASIFDRNNRAWLASEFGVRFASLSELEAMIE